MKWIERLLTAVLLLGLIALAGYFTYRFVTPSWAGAVFYGYLVAGLLVNTSGILLLTRDLKAASRKRDIILASYHQILSRPGRLGRFRAFAAQTIAVPEAVLTWPVDLLR